MTPELRPILTPPDPSPDFSAAGLVLALPLVVYLLVLPLVDSRLYANLRRDRDTDPSAFGRFYGAALGRADGVDTEYGSHGLVLMACYLATGSLLLPVLVSWLALSQSPLFKLPARLHLERT